MTMARIDRLIKGQLRCLFGTLLVKYCHHLFLLHSVSRLLFPSCDALTRLPEIVVVNNDYFQTSFTYSLGPLPHCLAPPIIYLPFLERKWTAFRAGNQKSFLHRNLVYS